MTLREIRRELEKVNREIDSWSQLRGVLMPAEVRRRELILIEQQILYRLEEAIETGDEAQEFFHMKLFSIIQRYLNKTYKPN